MFVTLRALAASALMAAVALAAPGAQAQDKVVFATNWKAQAAHGGFYQALVDGGYRKAGLEVTIQQGGPQVNNRPLLAAGKKIDYVGASGPCDFTEIGDITDSKFRYEQVKAGKLALLKVA